MRHHKGVAFKTSVPFYGSVFLVSSQFGILEETGLDVLVLGPDPGFLVSNFGLLVFD